MTGRPGAVALPWRNRRLRDHIGNSECPADGRSEQIGRLVMHVVGEPDVRPAIVAHSCREPSGEPIAERRQPCLSRGFTASIETAEAAKPAAFRDRRAQAPAAARARCWRSPDGTGCVGRFQRRIKRNPHRAARLAANRPARASAPACSEKRVVVRSKPALPSVRRSEGSPISRDSACASASGERGSISMPVTPSTISSGMPDTRVETQATRWLCASSSTFGSPSRSPSALTREGSTKMSALAIGVEHGSLRLRARPLRRDRRARACARDRQASREQRPAADVRKPPVQFTRKPRERVQEIVEPLLVDGAPDAEQHDGVRRVAAVAALRSAISGAGKRAMSMPW